MWCGSVDREFGGQGNNDWRNCDVDYLRVHVRTENYIQEVSNVNVYTAVVHVDGQCVTQKYKLLQNVDHAWTKLEIGDTQKSST